MKPAGLANIADGVAQELFAHEIKRIAANIADPNTAAAAKRKITLEFEFAPDEDRQEVKVHVSAKSSMAPTKGYSKTIYTGLRNKEPTLLSDDPKQTTFLDEGLTVIKSKREDTANA